MAAPPSPATSLNLSALSKLKLTTTPQGMRAFFIKFPAALGPLLAATLRKTLTRSTLKLNPFDSREASLFSLINNALVSCVQDDDDVIAMSTACGTNGPMALPSVAAAQVRVRSNLNGIRTRHAHRHVHDEPWRRHPEARAST